MYKILIVDDEIIVRKGIKKKIDWSSLGFEVIGEASNGREALDIAEKNAPDVILTDIKMPIMDGIEMTKIINTRMPYIDVVILTGHEEFEYAKESIKLGVLDYILKPISSTELRKSLGRIKENLDKKVNNDKQIKKLKSQIMKSMPVLRDRFLNDLIFTSMTEDEIRYKKDFVGIKFEGQHYTVLVVEISDYKLITERKNEEYKQLLKFSLINSINEVLNLYENTTVFIARYDYVTIILGGYKSECEIKNEIILLTEKIKQYVQKSIRVSVCVGVGHTYSALCKIRNSFKEALIALEYKFLLGKNSTIFVSDVQAEETTFFYYPKDIERSIITSIKLGSDREIRERLNDMFSSMTEQKNVTWAYIQVICNQLLTSVLTMVQEMGNYIDEIFGDHYNPYIDIVKYESIEDLKEWIESFFTKISSYITIKRDSRFKLIVDKAKAYIESNYQNSQISLNSVAQHVCISDCYFSVIFKKETRESFQDYLIKTRINKAKELFRTTDMKSYEIAYEVGYKDPHYFGVSFKKYVGVTPMEYKTMGKEDGSMWACQEKCSLQTPK